jgi:hypothetical protein
MHLLNIETFKLESYDDESTIPAYVILSHRWEEEEVLFEDLQELPYSQEIQDLRRKFKDLEERFENLQLQLEGEKSACRDTECVNTEQGGITLHKAEREGDGKSDSTWSDSHFRRARLKEKGWNKVTRCCKEAKAFGFSYVWIDTCCINKDSSSELSESINSMFSWYRNASLCIAYLSDVSSENVIDEFGRSKWFSRGWTLQELIAPDDVWFYGINWEFLGLRSVLASKIAAITSISNVVLNKNSQGEIDQFSVAARFSWAAGRVTTRAEDRAYSLLGLFGVNMPTIYGEGQQAAFFRLQVEIFKALPDHSIFAWYADIYDVSLLPTRLITLICRKYSFLGAEMNISREFDMFAPHVDVFLGASSIVHTAYRSNSYIPRALLDCRPAPSYSRFSHGICVPLLIRPTRYRFQACLACNIRGSKKVIIIDLREEEPGYFVRLPADIYELDPSVFDDPLWSLRDVYVSQPSGSLLWSWKRPTYQQAYNIVRVNDEQILGSGFERLRASLDLSVTQTFVTRVLCPKFGRGSHFSLDLFKTITEFGEIKLPGNTAIGTLMYQNRITKAQFAVVLAINKYKALAAVVDYSEAYYHLSKVILWDILSVRVISKPLRKGGTVFVGSCVPAVDMLQLNITAKSSTPLELSISC